MIRTGLLSAIVPFALGSAVLNAQTPLLPAVVTQPPAIPYRWSNVVIRGGGFVTGLVFSPTTRGLLYARTDVGGAYRSDDGGKHWLPLLDSLGRDEVSYLGIESLALDPSDPNKLYLAAGMYSSDWGGPSAIFRSSDKGRTFERTTLPLKMGGNDDGRGSGERLAVDPNLGSIIFFGSRRAGLWKSSDSGATWARVESFPVKEELGGPGKIAGNTFVLFDDSIAAKDTPTRTIYAGVAQAGASLYRSDDAGVKWKLVEGAPNDLFPSHAALHRGHALYLSFNDNIGPNGITNGAIWRYSLTDGKWSDVSPVKPGASGQRKFGFGGLAMDPEHPETLMATTIDRWGPEDTIFRSTNGGGSWKDIGATAQSSAPETPWVYWHRDHTGGRGWMNDIKIDPFDAGHVLYTTGEGIWGSENATAADAGKPTRWTFPNEGLEETVPLALLSPPIGPHLLSGVGDIGGFRHDNLQQSPRDGFFLDPQLNTTTSMDFAALAPAIVVRVGHGNRRPPNGGYSQDGGEHWKPFASDPSGSERGGGHIAISATGKTVIWSLDKGTSYWSEDWGRTWAACSGPPTSARIVSDRVDPLRFYSFNAESGELLESVDGARTFAARNVPVAPKGKRAVLAATPGIQGDLWVAAGDKVFHTTDAGETFVTLEGMAKVNTIGFGMASAQGQSPAIYIDGFAASYEGIFRSDDSGKSWHMLTDPDHRFGWKNDITGDPRVFGRVYLATGGRGIIVGEPEALQTSSNSRTNLGRQPNDDSK